MDIEQMKQAMRASAKTEVVHCQDIGEIKLRQLSAAVGMNLAKVVSDIGDDAASTNTSVLFNFYVDLISKSIVGDNDQLTFDSDEGRATLSQLRFVQLMQIGNACLSLNGMTAETAKKN